MKNQFHRNWHEYLIEFREFQITIGVNSKKRHHIVNSEGRLVGHNTPKLGDMTPGDTKNKIDGKKAL